MNMINLIPNITIHGENGQSAGKEEGFMLSPLTHMLGIMQRGMGEQLTSQNIGHNRAWNHPDYDFDQFKRDAQELLWNLYQPPPDRVEATTVRGFKEIRWTRSIIEAVSQIMPCSRFIFNYRVDHFAQAKEVDLLLLRSLSRRVELTPRESARPRAGTALNDIALIEMDLRRAFRKIPQLVYEMPLENFGVDRFNQLASWLGADCKFNGTLHSNRGGYNVDWDAAECRP
jgi:hypothetical protein